ncbi:hypothetical protein EVAR_69174_1 [Eumeta japonica]|uniref:Uncharacterized protein n=1 Tax=Eumeta variegata TaxID=151549 RepID=A0A4C1ZD50_EUMVA|nr:hypothetical protein EVAR_69174_1 [Eumeta japonica]
MRSPLLSPKQERQKHKAQRGAPADTTQTGPPHWHRAGEKGTGPELTRAPGASLPLNPSHLYIIIVFIIIITIQSIRAFVLLHNNRAVSRKAGLGRGARA